MPKKRTNYNERLLRAIVDGKSRRRAAITAKQFRSTVEQSKSESDIQQECVRWFREHYPGLAQEGMLFHIANEGIRLGSMGARVKREGVVRGVADLCLCVPMHGYGALYIEMKKKGTYQKPWQREWQKAAEKYGNKYVVCRSRAEFAVAINRYLSK